MQAPAPAPGISRLSETHRQCRSRPSGCAPNRGQLRHPHARQRARLAGPTASLSGPLHAHILFVAQPGGTLVWPDYSAGHSPRQFPKRPRTDSTDRGFRAALQPPLPPICLDCHCRLNLPETHQTLFAYFGDTTLVRRFPHHLQLKRAHLLDKQLLSLPLYRQLWLRAAAMVRNVTVAGARRTGPAFTSSGFRGPAVPSAATTGSVPFTRTFMLASSGA